LPKTYHSVFVTPLEDLFKNHFDKVTGINDQSGGDIPFRDWLDSIQQRNDRYLLPQTHAFQDVVNDLFAGWLDSESRFGVKPPDNEVVPPLPRWANPKRGPYTIAVNLELQQEFGVRMSVVIMGPTLSKNIAMWGALAHECGHDITIADNGLLEEFAKNINSEILKSPEL
jgi:hypothetical protein